MAHGSQRTPHEYKGILVSSTLLSSHNFQPTSLVHFFMPTPSAAYLKELTSYDDPPEFTELTRLAGGALNPRESKEMLAEEETPDDYIPGLHMLGSTYDVLNGKYADSRSALQQVLDWEKSGVRLQEFGGKKYSVPSVVNFVRNTTSEYRSSFGKTTSEYANSLSIQAGFEASFPGFSASASADYTDAQRDNLSHAFSRITYEVTHYTLSLPPVSQTQRLLKAWFAEDLEKRDPIEFFKEYGTHLLSSATIGGRALFLTTTDTRTYSAELSIEAAAKISASYSVASGGIELSTKAEQARKSFNESSEIAIVTKGGDPRYGNQNFLDNVEAWAASILNFPEFVEFGRMPCFIGLWDLASTKSRQDVLRRAYAQFVTQYAKNLELPGPYIHARLSQSFDHTKSANFITRSDGMYFKYVEILFPNNRADQWYFISPGMGLKDFDRPCIIAKELVPGALAPVRWIHLFDTSRGYGQATRFWRAVPPTPDYVALGCVAHTMYTNDPSFPSQPSESLAGQFRAIHKRALTGAKDGATWIRNNVGNMNRLAFYADYRYVLADTEIPPQEDVFVLDPKMCVRGWTGW
ncbi:hypothetical protein BDY19DRAFT_958469 [Irpex rosettiformis]|uniref:Uncharacterized protein n=1 Tax=Irpex rosettiformis TaxID=378272 RepID=A0ACB8TXR0_9APHY|nr:hypothetical protein BDY19DRAFT_958469 [Irpex rosettiformis]